MKNSKILVVENERIVALDIRTTLEQADYIVTDVVATGIDAITSVQSDPPDLILLDIMLKGELSGIDTAKIIEEKFRIPIIYLTALNDEETINRARETGPYGFLLKPFDPRELKSLIEIALYKSQIEKKIKEKNIELTEEKKRTQLLLENILPKHLISELKDTGKVTPSFYDDISILFVDLYNIQNETFLISPEKFLNELNSIYNLFDDITDELGLEKMKTIGDTYMIAGGIPAKTDNHANKVVEAALQMKKAVEEKSKNSDLKYQFRAGINTGEVVAGVVGTKKFTYDIWGDSVNIASRMSSSSQPGEINVSASTYEKIKDNFICEPRGKLNVKGKGEIDMYFVKGYMIESDKVPLKSDIQLN